MPELLARSLVIDLETRADPTIELSPEWLAHLEAKIEPDGRLKDPLKIEADKQAKLATALSRLALSPLTGIIACIGWRVLEEPDDTQVHVVKEVSREAEREMLENFAQEMPLDPHRLVGWNIQDFDIPFMIGRSLVHGIELPWWPTPRNYREVVDLYRGLGIERTLSEWSFVLGLGFKAVEGEDVLKLPLAELAQHCREDINTTALIAERTRFVWGS